MTHSGISPLHSDALGGHRLTEPEALLLMNAQGRDLLRVAAAADEMRERRVGDMVTSISPAIITTFIGFDFDLTLPYQMSGSWQIRRPDSRHPGTMTGHLN